MQFPVHIPFVEQLGLTLESIDDGTAELRLTVAEQHLNSWRVAHGGVVMTLLDVAMAHAARSVNRQQADLGPGVVTVEMKTSFMRPAGSERRYLKVPVEWAQSWPSAAKTEPSQNASVAERCSSFPTARSSPSPGRMKLVFISTVTTPGPRSANCLFTL
ncbi:MAG: PaaI family thioesterase, partial [Rubrivivax sp.]